jgi:hypothetical protein
MDLKIRGTDGQVRKSATRFGFRVTESDRERIFEAGPR